MNDHELTISTGVMRVSADDKSNPELAAELSDLRGCLYGAIPAPPERYSIAPHPDRPAIILTDTADAAREPLTVGLCDSHGASHMLTFINRCEWARKGQGRRGQLNLRDRRDGAALIFTDLISGETVRIGLCNALGARKTLTWLGLTSTRED